VCVFIIYQLHMSELEILMLLYTLFMFHIFCQYIYKLEVMQRKGLGVLCVHFVYLNP